MLKFRRTESVNVDVRKFCSDVLQKIDVPLERQLRMMPALHQDLHSAHGSEFVELLVQLLEAQNVVVFIALGSIKCAELTVNIANVRVIDVSIDDIGHDVLSAAAVTLRFCKITARIGKRCQFLQ